MSVRGSSFDETCSLDLLEAWEEFQAVVGRLVGSARGADPVELAEIRAARSVLARRAVHLPPVGDGYGKPLIGTEAITEKCLIGRQLSELTERERLCRRRRVSSPSAVRWGARR